MSSLEASKTSTKKAVIIFYLGILGFNPLLSWFHSAILEDIFWEYFIVYACTPSQCLVPLGIVTFASLASYSYGIIVGLGILRWILRTKGNYLGTFAYALIGAVPTFLLILAYLENPLALLNPTYGVVLGIGFSVIVGVASGFGYVKEGRGFLSWVRVLGVFSGAFFLIVGIGFIIFHILGP